VEGKPANKLKLTSKSGEVSYFLFDASTGIVLKWEGNRKINGKDVPWQIYYRDFREVNGIKYPFLVESGPVGAEDVQKIVAQKIEVNIPMDDARFGKPNPPAPTAAPSGDPAPNKPNNE
jgi:hypothetical protein